MDIQPGVRVAVRSAFGDELIRRAISGVEAGSDFPVVWVCHEEEWAASVREGREADAVPWPAKDVSVTTR